MIGLSVSNCIRDIITGVVSLDNVEKIVAGTACYGPNGWDGVIGDYRREYWQSNPDEGERILRQLIAEDRVLQPRLKEKKCPFATNEQGRTNWVNTESEIRWRSEYHS